MLLAGLPNANGGSMPPGQATLVLDELDLFTNQARIENVVLVDEATGRVLMTYIAAYDGVVMLGPGYRAGVDLAGFFVLDPDTDPPVTLFRAGRFGQRLLPSGEVEFTGGRRWWRCRRSVDTRQRRHSGSRLRLGRSRWRTSITSLGCSGRPFAVGPSA